MNGCDFRYLNMERKMQISLLFVDLQHTADLYIHRLSGTQRRKTNSKFLRAQRCFNSRIKKYKLAIDKDKAKEESELSSFQSM